MSYGPVKLRAEILQQALKNEGIESVLDPVDADSEISVEKDGRFLMTRHYKAVVANEAAGSIKQKM
jgi:hypothetical protein